MKQKRTRKPGIIQKPRIIETAYFKVDSDLVARLKKTQVVMFRVTCDGRWDKTRVAILENKEDGCEHKMMTIDVGMTLSQFYKAIQYGREVIFYSDVFNDFTKRDVFFQEKHGAVFRIDKITGNDRFNLKECMIDGPEHDME